MSESQTPRTDAATHDDWSGGAEATEPEVSRQLESELTATRARLAEIEAVLSSYHMKGNPAELVKAIIDGNIKTTSRLAELEGIAERPRRVCLCGSSRWVYAHHKAMMEETLAGRIVIPMGLYGHADYPIGAKAATNDGDESNAVKQMQDRLHLARIDLADEILVVNVGGYIGSSTAREIEYAKQKGKTVRFLEAYKEGKK